MASGCGRGDLHRERPCYQVPVSEIPPDEDDETASTDEAVVQPPVGEEAAWLASVLGVSAGDWSAICSLTRRVPPYEVPSLLLAMAGITPRLDVAFFNQGFATNTRLAEVPDGDDIRIVESSEASVAFRVAESPVVARLERDPTLHTDEPRLVLYAATPDAAAAGVRRITEMIRGEASTWRRRAVVLDPTPAALFRPLSVPSAPPPPPARAEAELRRSLLDPIARIRSGGEGGGCSILVTGPTGSGKSSLVRWLSGELAGTATVVVLPPRVLANADLLHLAFEMAEDDAPSVVILDHLDLVLGDRYSMRYPESLAELVSQLDDLIGRQRVFTLATALSPDPLDEVLTARLTRRLQLGAVSRSDRESVLAELVEEHASGDRALLEALLRRTQHWSHGALVELRRMAASVAASGQTVDLLALSGQVGKTVTCTPTEEGDGTYL